MHRPMGRRAMLKRVGGMALATMLWLPDELWAAAGHVLTPAMTEGPFFVDGQLRRSNLLTGYRNASDVAGLPLTLTLTIIKGAVPLAGAHVDVWHANAAGVYSDEAGEDSQGTTFLRGYQVTDPQGRVSFKTIYPGWYPGRTPHIHLMVRTRDAWRTDTWTFDTQLFFHDTVSNQVYRTAAPYRSRGHEDTTNANDGIFNSPGRRGQTAGEENTLRLSGSPETGFEAPFTLYLPA